MKLAVKCNVQQLQVFIFRILHIMNKSAYVKNAMLTLLLILFIEKMNGEWSRLYDYSCCAARRYPFEHC